MIGLALLLTVAGIAAAPCRMPVPDGMVERRAPFGGVIAPTAAQADEAVLAGRVAQAAAVRYLGLDALSFLITPAPASEREACPFVFHWRFPVRPDGGSRLPTHVLPHEIGHALFIRFLAPRTDADEYGGGAPDWLDEMAAIAFEDAAGTRIRRADAHRHAERGALIPLARLLAMRHPQWTPDPASVAADPMARGRLASAPLVSRDTPAFYATVRALFDFLVARTGDERIVRTLADRFRDGVPLGAWLRTHADPGSGGSERTFAALDAALATYVLTDPDYAAASRPLAPGSSR